MSTIEVKTDAQPKNRRPLILAAASAAILGLVIGALIGAAANSHSGELSSLRTQVSQLRSQLTDANNQAATAQQQTAQAQQQAASAQASAQAQAQAQYASKMAQANALLRKLQHQQAVVQSSTISADGVYVVGKDIPAGVYHTSGGGECYYATLNSTNTFDIIDNNNFNGPETVDVSGAYAFQIQGGCTWVKE